VLLPQEAVVHAASMETMVKQGGYTVQVRYRRDTVPVQIGSSQLLRYYSAIFGCQVRSCACEQKLPLRGKIHL
jgi:hypothetical protein